jgi:transcription initiation factor TFIIIB Brf1 subunit/transcription initiation factor TFIIB
MEWITIKEVCNLTNKSESTIRNLARKLKALKSKDIRLEKLRTGHEKILFKLSYVNSQLLIDKPIKNKQLKQDSDSDKMLSILERELNEKNKQIEALTDRLKESNLLYAQLQESIKLIEAPKKKKRWGWW